MDTLALPSQGWDKALQHLTTLAPRIARGMGPQMRSVVMGLIAHLSGLHPHSSAAVSWDLPNTLESLSWGPLLQGSQAKIQDKQVNNKTPQLRCLKYLHGAS